jgi:Nineteen complex-related protein 2
VVRRPGLSNAPKNKSKLRVSFGPVQGGADDDLSEDAVSGFKTLRKANLAKQSAGNNLLKRSWSPSRPLEPAILGSTQDADRPSYSKDYLNELRNSTPSTPRDLSSYTSEDDGPLTAVDVLSNFSTIHEQVDQPAIPTEAEIREKKERRARLAKEQDFISLDDDGGGRYMQLSTRKESKETRLVRDDEDIAEGFDDYVEDAGRVALGKKAKVAQQKKERESMRDLIADAENISDEGSEAERILAYETTQTRNAMDGLGLGNGQKDPLTRAPTIITPIPRLSSVIERLQSSISSLEYTRARLSKQMADLQQEKAEIAVRETDIQRLLLEAGEKYGQLRADTKANGTATDAADSRAKTERGLESIGNS